jgi:(p)ppGpp synthase/HD superfamily hydrolase
MNEAKFKKMKSTFRYWLLGKADTNPEYFRVLKAMEIAEKYHTGTRKDSKTPSFSHQISICLYLKTIHKYLKDPVTVLIVALFHDTLEDFFNASTAELMREFPNEYHLIMRISKVRNGVKIPYEQYFREIKNCEVCSIIKLVDRVANISTMIGVFNQKKQVSYLDEVDTWFFPMLKHARRMFPEQELAYENVKSFLTIQRDTILVIRKEEINNDRFKKMKSTLRYWLLGKADDNPEYYRVLKSMEIAEKYHTGTRKDGKTPEFSHQLFICLYLKTMHKYLKDPVTTLITALLHDTLEDYFEESSAELMRLFPNEYHLIMRISKVRNGVKIPYDQYFGEMKDCHICSIVKLADRVANISTMIGVFTEEKQISYLEEVNAWFLPMLKYARRMFPEQELAYENVKSFLIMQKDTILALREENFVH